MKKKVLIVEDEDTLADGYSLALVSQGFYAFRAKNGSEGLDMALKIKPDLILLDILMPVMDGLTMLSQLRQKNDYGKKVPVILLTNLNPDKEEIISKVAETGPSYYIVKVDCTFRQVVDKIQEILKGK